MTIYTLYVKTHRKTGLKYLGQTSQNPFKYPGSGVDWATHLKEFGNDILTEILLQTTDKSERNRLGRYYSALWHVVTAADDFGNKIWANKIPENGGGGGGRGGSFPGDSNPSKRPEVAKAISLGLKGVPKSVEHKKSLSLAKKGKPFKNRYITPKGSTWTQKNPSEKLECPHCCKLFNPGNYQMWHGDKCKSRKTK